MFGKFFACLECWNEGQQVATVIARASLKWCFHDIQRIWYKETWISTHDNAVKICYLEIHQLKSSNYINPIPKYHAKPIKQSLPSPGGRSGGRGLGLIPLASLD